MKDMWNVCVWGRRGGRGSGGGGGKEWVEEDNPGREEQEEGRYTVSHTWVKLPQSSLNFSDTGSSRTCTLKLPHIRAHSAHTLVHARGRGYTNMWQHIGPCASLQAGDSVLTVPSLSTSMRSKRKWLWVARNR